jgi:hypothetical protein
MGDIKIFDKIIPQGYADQIEADITRTGFPWFYIDDITNANYGNNSGFVHAAYDYGKEPSEWYPFIKPIVYAIAEANEKPLLQLLRIRIGFLTTAEVVEHNTPHIDFTIGHYTACYYVTDSDGDTVVFDQTLAEVKSTNITEQVLKEYVEQTTFTEAGRCSPKKGRLCVFDGTRFHASSKPTQHDRRLVITVNYVS